MTVDLHNIFARVASRGSHHSKQNLVERLSVPIVEDVPIIKPVRYQAGRGKLAFACLHGRLKNACSDRNGTGAGYSNDTDAADAGRRSHSGDRRFNHKTNIHPPAKWMANTASGGLAYYPNFF
jgi:hypothetical protein